MIPCLTESEALAYIDRTLPEEFNLLTSSLVEGLWIVSSHGRLWFNQTTREECTIPRLNSIKTILNEWGPWEGMGPPLDVIDLQANPWIFECLATDFQREDYPCLCDRGGMREMSVILSQSEAQAYIDRINAVRTRWTGLSTWCGSVSCVLYRALRRVKPMSETVRKRLDEALADSERWCKK